MLRAVKSVLWIGIIAVICGGAISWKSRIWTGQERYTLVNLTPNIAIESLDPVTKRGIRIKVPGEMLVETVGGRGKWKAGVIKELEKKYGAKWASDSVANTFGISYIYRSNLVNWWDSWSWWWWKRKVIWEEVDLENGADVSETDAPDGVKVKQLTEIGKAKIGEMFVSVTLAEERISVTVVNTTNIDGLGGHAANVISNSGIRVNAVENTQDKAKECQLEGAEKIKNSLTGRWLRRTFGCPWKISEALPKEAILRLGTGYSEWWLGED